MTLYSWAYRKFKQFMHKRNWHHMTVCHPDGDTQHWCQWCGLRVTIPKPDPMAGYKAGFLIYADSPYAGICINGAKVPCCTP